MGSGQAMIGSSSYAEALRERLQRARVELDAQTANVLALRENLTSTRADAETHSKELTALRDEWAAEKPQREALLKEAGEKEKKISGQRTTMC